MISLSPSTRVIVALAALTASGSAILASAQPVRRAARARRQDAQKNQPFHFGDITLSNYSNMKGVIGQSAEARGPNTTVDVADPKQPKVKTRIMAELLKAQMSQSGGNEVERIEAVGNVRYSSSRPTDAGETQVTEGTASRAVYQKSKGQLTLEGPIRFTGKLFDKTGKAIQSVQGKSRSAQYDEIRQIVSLDGDVDATFMAPNLKDPATLTDASDITVDLSKTPLEYDIKGGRVRFEPAEPKKGPAKKNP